MVGRRDATKVSNTKEERKEERKEEKREEKRNVREKSKEEMEKFEPRKEKKKRKKFHVWGGNSKTIFTRVRVSENHKSAHTNTRTHLIVPRVCSFSFFVFVIRARIRHHFRIRERDEIAADDDDDDFIIGRRRIFAIIFTIIEEEK